MGVTAKAVTVAAALAAFVCAGSAAGATPTSLTLKVISVSKVDKEHDVGPKGASKGDTVVYADALLNTVAQLGKKAGAQVGTDTGTMTFTSSTTAVFKGIAKLPGGTLTLSGAVTANAKGELMIPVSSGTGRFAGMYGTLTVGSGAGKKTPNTYVLMLGTVA